MGHFFIMEFLGTFVFTLALVLSSEPLPIGLALMAMIYIGGHISGAHYNPAVSLASWVQRGLNNEALLSYMGAQVLGAVAALMFARRITGTPYALDLPSNNLFDYAFMEALLVIVLVLVVLTVAKAAAYKGSSVQGLVIGLTFAALISFGLNPTILNPAVAAASLLTSLFFEGGMVGGPNVVLVYIVSPLIGGALAAWLYNFLNDRK